MIFVTHRFGHLTKFADQIMSVPLLYPVFQSAKSYDRCMKDGSIVESGKHNDLLAADGEYAKLYNIQASAFKEASITNTLSK